MKKQFFIQTRLPISLLFQLTGLTSNKLPRAAGFKLVIQAFNKKSVGKPKIIIAKTVKGKGVDYMENEVLWHYKPPNDKELRNALKQIGY